jgi:hypothetical protein
MSDAAAIPADPSGGYTLVVPVWPGGLFSNLNRVVNLLHHRLGRDHCAAVRVDWTLAEQLPEVGFGTLADGDLWRRFFEPLSFPGAPARELQSGWEYADWSMTGLHAYRMYKLDRGWRAAYGATFARHVFIRPALRERAQQLVRETIGDRHTIGVHLRHPRSSVEAPRGAPSIDYFIARTRELQGRRTDSCVFLATDVSEAIAAFRDAFGDRLVVQSEVPRASVAEEQIHHRTASVASGQSALVDALVLSECDALLHTVSNLATAVGYISPKPRMVYCEPRLVGVGSSLRARLTPRLRRLGPAGLSRGRSSTPGGYSSGTNSS